MSRPVRIMPAIQTKIVFIVGVSRSGTTLMRKTLNSSNQIAISHENHFLGHFITSEGVRYKFRKFGDLSNDNNVRRLVDFLYDRGLVTSSRYRNIMSRQWRWIIEKVDKEDFLQKILNSDRSERALFVIMMQVYAEYYGSQVMGEKTPVHIRHVPTLFEWFPQAKFIHMLRDPRAIFASELRRRKELAVTTPYKQLSKVGFLFRLYILLQTTIFWYEGINRYFKYKKLCSDNYRLLRFEDLVTQPEKHIRQVCDFLEVDFQDQMLDRIVVSKGFQAGQSGFDAQAATRWKSHINSWENAWFRFWFRKHLKKFNYVE